MANAADMMMARDAAARAWAEVQAADAAWNAEASEANNARQARAVAAWKKAVKNTEAVQRKVWATQDRAAA